MLDYKRLNNPVFLYFKVFFEYFLLYKIFDPYLFFKLYFGVLKKINQILILIKILNLPVVMAV